MQNHEGVVVWGGVAAPTDPPSVLNQCDSLMLTKLRKERRATNASRSRTNHLRSASDFSRTKVSVEGKCICTMV